MSLAAPCEAWFYHLERSSGDDVLPGLLEKTLERGWRALVVTGAPARLETLDALLWSYRAESFLPHGVAGEPEAAHQPILLSASGVNENAAQVLFLVDGAATTTWGGFIRSLDLFDGRDPQALQDARTRWRGAKAAGASTSYWRQTENGRWTRQD